MDYHHEQSKPAARQVMKPIAFIVHVALALMLPALGVADSKVFKLTPHSNLTILDPIWTTAYITRNHGYMIYDTLFGTDEKGEVKPQMVDQWSASADQKTYTFTLRDGLVFQDGKLVTSEDVVASLTRWAQRDSMGQELAAFTDKMEAVDARTFRIVLKEPYGLVLASLGKVSSNVPFIMPRRVAATPPDKQIEEFIGSGPFVFKKDEWKPGEKVVYAKNANYRPRTEPASGTAGGKVVKVDRVEWIIIKDPQTQANALTAGEIDAIEALPFELYGALKGNAKIQVVNYYPAGFQAFLRMNHLQPPFNNPKVRQAALAAINQEAIMRTQVGVRELYRTCASFYPCQTPYATTAALDMLVKPDMKRAQQLLKDSGYDATPVVLMQPTDLAPIAKAPVVVTQLLRQAGFKVDMQAMDWQTLVARRAKRDPPANGGWSAFITWTVAAEAMNPISNIPLNAACDKAWFGWPCDEEILKLRERFVRASDETQRKSIAEQIQRQAAATVTHVPLGEFSIPLAVRNGIKGIVNCPVLVGWNISKD
jgi:peptide/nickel transport system substrate-binding protein